VDYRDGANKQVLGCEECGHVQTRPKQVTATHPATKPRAIPDSNVFVLPSDWGVTGRAGHLAIPRSGDSSIIKGLRQKTQESS
jgi:hypothetical protein